LKKGDHKNNKHKLVINAREFVQATKIASPDDVIHISSLLGGYVKIWYNSLVKGGAKFASPDALINSIELKYVSARQAIDNRTLNKKLREFKQGAKEIQNYLSEFDNLTLQMSEISPDLKFWTFYHNLHLLIRRSSTSTGLMTTKRLVRS
jgi:hypothetical protein